MASSTDELESGAGETSKSSGGKLPMVPLVMAMVVAVIVGAGVVGGGMMYLMKSGKLGVGSVVTRVEAHEVVAPPKTHSMIIEPILVNLMDPGNRAYLRIGITMRVRDEELVKGAKPAAEEKAPAKGAKEPSEEETAARDTVLTVLGQQTSESLLEADGKELLKGKLRAALTAKNPELKVTDLFFTEYLVQH